MEEERKPTKQCPVCDFGYLMEPPDGQESYLLCSECEAIQLLYQPLPHQTEFHKDTHKYKAFFGGFGSGKTRTGAEEIIRHVLETPGGMTFIGAQTIPQLEQTSKKEFFLQFPKRLIESYHKQQNLLVCKNGHTVLFRSCDDEGKIRSLNLSAFWIEEASEVSHDIFVQLQTRLRNTATKKHLGIITSNPDLGWIRQEFLLKSERIENAQTVYHQNPDSINKDFSSHIAPTDLNIHLPPDFYESNARGKPKWWIERFLNGSFEHTSDQVYPYFAQNIIPPFEIPDRWERMYGVDFGLRHPTVLLSAAIDPVEGVVHIFNEYYQAERSIPHHAQKMNEEFEKVPPGLIRFIAADPAGKRRSEKDMRSIYDHYAEYNIFFKMGLNKIEDGIFKVYSYLDLGKLKIHANCVHTIQEGINYKYKEATLDNSKPIDEKPKDIDNHTMDALRYIIAELPDDPENLKNPSFSHFELYKNQLNSQRHLPYALQDNEESEDLDWSDYY